MHGGAAVTRWLGLLFGVWDFLYLHLYLFISSPMPTGSISFRDNAPFRDNITFSSLANFLCLMENDQTGKQLKE